LKTIKLHIDNKVYKKLKTELIAKKMYDSYGGIADSFAKKVLQLLEENVEEYTIEFKNKK
tara:strand:+ start:1900 stop:2079 length:180 start_codon:yes stop_codon:yes gene_type:complete